jgi:drug/metabolite transporter (DMT)-like permease
MDRRRLIGTVLVVVAATGFGTGTVLSKPVYAMGLDWLQLLAWRFTIGATLAWTWLLIGTERRAALVRLSPRQALAAIGLGVWYSGNAGTYYAGLETVPASLAGVLVYIYPAMVAVLSLRFVIRLEGRRPWIALGIALAGVVLALGGIDLSKPPPVAGIALVLCSPLIYAGWIILSARLAGERSEHLAPTSGGDHADDASVATALMITATAVLFVSGALAAGRPLAPTAMPAAAWPNLLGLGFASTFLAIQGFYAGSRRIGAAQAALISTVEPVVIVALAWLVLGDILRPLQLVGAGLVIVGVLVAQTGPRPQNAPQPARPLDAESG